jgi:hypothetical protein
MDTPEKQIWDTRYISPSPDSRLITFEISGIAMGGFDVRVRSSQCSEEDDYDEITIHRVKLEKGKFGTEWTQTGEGYEYENTLMPANKDTGNYSWKFSTKHGMMMWNGAQGSGMPSNDTNLVFKVDKAGAYLSGTIVSKKGEIAGWQLDGDGFTTPNFELGKKGLALFSTPRQGAAFGGNE